MSERKSWTKMEDRVLKLLRQQKGYKKWSEVAQIMRTQYGIQGRNGKQCRERYHNRLDQRISKDQWTQKQDQELLTLHNKYGNRWALIAREIKGRTDNCVKNRFYSRFRRSIRAVNGLIKIFWKKQFKQLKPTFISKAIEITQQYRTYEEGHKKQVFDTCEDLKCRLMSYSDATEEQLKQNSQRLNSLYNLIKQINSFNRKNKRKGKKKRKQSSDQQDGDDFSKEEKPKIKFRKNRKISQIDEKKKKTIGESSNIFVKKQQENYSKAVCNIIGKPVQSKNTQIDSQNISGHRIILEEGSNHDYDRLGPNQDDHSDKRKIETFDCINQKAQQGFDINQFYSLQDLGYQEGPSFY